MKIFITISILALIWSCNPSSKSINEAEVNHVSFNISKRYINLPVSQGIDRAKMNFEIDGKKDLEFVIRLAPVDPDYWVFYDVSPFIGKDLKIYYAGNPEEI